MAGNKSGMSRENRAHLKDEIQSLLSSIGTESHNDLVVVLKFLKKLGLKVHMTLKK